MHSYSTQPAEADSSPPSQRSDNSPASQLSSNSDPSPPKSPSRHRERVLPIRSERVTVPSAQNQRPEASNPAVQRLSYNSQAALNHYQALYRKTSRASKFLVELTPKEYTELQNTLECDPPLCAFVRSSVCTKWTLETLIILMPTEVHKTVVVGVRKKLLAQLEAVRDAASNTGEVSRLAQRVELVESTRTVNLLAVRSTDNGPALEPLRFIPDASFTFNRRKTPLLVLEVGYSEDKASMHANAILYLQTRIDKDCIKTVILISLPYQEPEARKRQDCPLPTEGTCVVYRADRASGKLVIDIKCKKFMNKNRRPGRGRNLDLRLSDFCLPECDIPISISSQELVELFEKGVTAELEDDADDADEKESIKAAKRALEDDQDPPVSDYHTVCTGDSISLPTSEASDTESDVSPSSEPAETFNLKA
ncbi:uncharacterized protein EKO05_0001803 [Ascochyta rabiei]|uniref:Uncharacterized protein n=1 Tax=Didymella rabiei TaxID=5454 RepID=A0A163HFW1_DIDRA|nr:uncharacterized protein EKO05_0001803 [Ascochyta rabiei]KZM25275.1 hypothetical protein ST47_g3589 [Ascochyta rabiei]UPX11181.1 hypothetical protein EKO05_0001803 [Ascochyta rabiei]